MRYIHKRVAALVQIQFLYDLFQIQCTFWIHIFVLSQSQSEFLRLLLELNFIDLNCDIEEILGLFQQTLTQQKPNGYWSVKAHLNKTVFVPSTPSTRMMRIQAGPGGEGLWIEMGQQICPDAGLLKSLPNPPHHHLILWNSKNFTLLTTTLQQQSV